MAELENENDFDFDEYTEEEIAAPKVKPKLRDKKVTAKVGEPKRQFIIKSNKVDAYTTIRKRELLTPSMCTVTGCNFDAAKRHGGWGNAPESQHDTIKKVLEQHNLASHNRSEDLILSEDELPTQWLGVKTTTL